jgi:hypothetical protein
MRMDAWSPLGSEGGLPVFGRQGAQVVLIGHPRQPGEDILEVVGRILARSVERAKNKSHRLQKRWGCLFGATSQVLSLSSERILSSKKSLSGNSSLPTFSRSRKAFLMLGSAASTVL